MARSSYIYIVSIASFPLAAFTVKHELESWLKEQAAPQECRIMRLRDGKSGPVQFYSASEITGESYPEPIAAVAKIDLDDTPPYP